jgi:hypothetical protein
MQAFEVGTKYEPKPRPKYLFSSLSKVGVTEPTPSLLPQFCQNDQKLYIFAPI